MATTYTVKFRNDDQPFSYNIPKDANGDDQITNGFDRFSDDGEYEYYEYTVADDRLTNWFEQQMDQADSVVEYEVVEYGKTDVKTVTLSDDEPKGREGFYSGYTKGDDATIFYDASNKAYGFCFHGIGEGGNYYESEDAVGFDTAEEAEQVARDTYAETLAYRESGEFN